MFYYDNETIKQYGYESPEAFLKYLLTKYINCCFRLCPDGLWFAYDSDTNIAINNSGYIDEL